MMKFQGNDSDIPKGELERKSSSRTSDKVESLLAGNEVKHEKASIEARRKPGGWKSMPYILGRLSSFLFTFIYLYFVLLSGILSIIEINITFKADNINYVCQQFRREVSEFFFRFFLLCI